MTDLLSIPVWALAGGLVCLLALGAATIALAGGARAQRRRAQSTAAELEELRARTEQLSERVERLGGRQTRALADPSASSSQFLITDIDKRDDAEGEDSAVGEERIEGTLFADLVLRESAVRAATLAAGVRRAMASETRNKIRFAMRQEVKRARKQRRRELRVARREYEAQRRDAA